MHKINTTGKLFIIAAPSGSGKTSVSVGVVNLLKDLLQIERVITFTTRKPRINEIPGKDYHFISVEQFLELKKRGLFLESTEYNGNFYASSSSIVTELKNGKSFIMVADVAGAKNLKNNIIPSAITIWITVKNLEILKNRLEQRKTDSADVVEDRLKMAESEIKKENAENFFQYHVLNDNLDNTIQTIASIIKKELGFKH